MAWLLTLKSLLISTGVFFMALGLKLSVPLVMEFLASHVPLIWSFFLSWLKPPYLYVVIIFIIISIVASSRFHKDHNQNSIDNLQTRTAPPLEDEGTTYYLKPQLVEVQAQSDFVAAIQFQIHNTIEAEEEEEEDAPELVKNVVVEDEIKVADKVEKAPEYLSPAEKPLVSARLCHREPTKASPEGGRALRRVGKPKRHETMENTWKAIMERTSTPLSRHVSKRDTWENHGRDINMGPIERYAVKKSETFKDRTSQTEFMASLFPSYEKLRREPSLSHDELNRRVEAFIKKFNEDMRLERQESLNQYMKLINGEK